MHDRHQSPPRNGQATWQPPSFADIILNRLDRLDYHMMQQVSRLGGLEHGQATGLQNDMEIFGVLRNLGDRLSTVETHQEHLQGGPPPMAPQGMLASITEALPPFKALIGYVLWLAIALGAAVDPEKAKTLLELLGAVN